MLPMSMSLLPDKQDLHTTEFGIKNPSLYPFIHLDYKGQLYKTHLRE